MNVSRLWSELRFRLRAVVRRGVSERELADELAGVGEAERDATAEACRDQRGIGWLETTVCDLRFGWRFLWRAPGSTVVAAMTLAIGIGAACAIASMAAGVLLHPVGYAQPAQLVQLSELVPAVTNVPIAASAPDIPAMRARGTPFQAVAAYSSETATLSGVGVPDRIPVTRVSANLLTVLQVAPLLGRDFRPDEESAGHNLVILSAALWKQRFGASLGVLGRTLDLDGQPFTVIGVMPSSFEFPPRGLPGYEPAAVWVPLALSPAELSERGDNFDFGVLARLRPRATLAQAQASMVGAGNDIWKSWGSPRTSRVQVVATSLVRDLIRPVAALMYLLLSAAGLLLLMGCANVANLLLARGSTRRHELALRTALGAGRRRVVRQLATESMLLGLLSCVGGLALAWGMGRVLARNAPPALPQLRTFGLHPLILALAIGLSLLCGLLCGLAPAWCVDAHDWQSGLREGASATDSGRVGLRLRSGLVVAQVAVAFVLVTGAALLVQSFVSVEAAGAGVQPQRRVAATLDFPTTAYSHHWQIAAALDRTMVAIAHRPAVHGVAASSDLPTHATWGRSFTLAGAPPARQTPVALFSVTIGDYPAVLGVPVLQGRWFTPAEDRAPNPKAPVVVVSQSLARTYWPGRSALGQQLLIAGKIPNTVVGVIGDVKGGALDLPVRGHIYAPYRQMCDDTRPYAQCAHLYLFSQGPNLAAAVTAMRAAAADSAPGVPVTQMRTLSSILQSSIAPRRFNTLLLTIFGGAALLLALVGLYAVMAFSVSERRSELSLRLVLGARPRAICGHVLASGGILVVIGLAIGAMVELELSGWLRSLLYAPAGRGAAWVGSATALILAALLACLLPAWRALRADPAGLLRRP